MNEVRKFVAGHVQHRQTVRTFQRQGFDDFKYDRFQHGQQQERKYIFNRGMTDGRRLCIKNMSILNSCNAVI